MDMLREAAMETWATFTEMAPYLLFGFAVAGILSVLISQEKIERHLGAKGLLPVLKASLFGVPLPLCSCGVIPVAASLRKHGAGRGATMAFLLSTPQTGADSILVTYSLLGPVFAIFRPIAAFVTGVAGGWLADRLDRPTKEEAPKDADEDTCTDECCAPKTDRGRLFRMLKYGFVVLPRDIAKPLLIGVLVAGAIGALVPDDFFTALVGSGLAAMLVMMLLGIPIYVCATASVPIAAVLIAKGVSPGAALVFLMTGPATNAATITTVWKVLGKSTAFVYLGTVAGTALISGILLDYVFDVSGMTPNRVPHRMLPDWTDTAAAVVLLVVLGAAAVRRRRPQHAHHECPACEGEE